MNVIFEKGDFPPITIADVLENANFSYFNFSVLDEKNLVCKNFLETKKELENKCNDKEYKDLKGTCKELYIKSGWCSFLSVVGMLGTAISLCVCLLCIVCGSSSPLLLILPGLLALGTVISFGSFMYYGSIERKTTEIQLLANVLLSQQEELEKQIEKDKKPGLNQTAVPNAPPLEEGAVEEDQDPEKLAENFFKQFDLKKSLSNTNQPQIHENEFFCDFF